MEAAVRLARCVYEEFYSTEKSISRRLTTTFGVLTFTDGSSRIQEMSIPNGCNQLVHMTLMLSER